MKTPPINTTRMTMIALNASFEDSFGESASKIIILSPSSSTFVLIGLIESEVVFYSAEFSI